MTTPAVFTRVALTLSGAAGGLALLLGFRTPEQGTAAPVGSPPTTPTSQPSPAGPVAPGSESSSSSTATGTSLKDGAYRGQDVPNEYGDVQVQVIVSGGRITDVRSLLLPSDRARSAYISQVAGPLLHDEALAAQSAQIDIISGATFTSDSYAQSLQSALDQAR